MVTPTSSLHGLTLTEVIISLAVMVIFSVSAISAFIVNQKSALISIYNTEANRYMQETLDVINQTNFSAVANFSATNYSINLDALSPTLPVAGSTGFKTFQTRPGSEWKTNVNSSVAYETMVNVSNTGAYKRAEVFIYWRYLDRFMTNRTVVLKANDNVNVTVGP
ncbi:MAG: prepilin-type N-terminal cleavage/methylation domain-containing protein [Verrucomicrobiota bacterium]|nr:prepilin-type N-terminal cleavage/methylation domain-containing protein [Verrucomicrobiota bacterium]